ncbi:MAG: L,D-transpeptidase family protein [Planctomycetaceae bacterium]
MSLRTGSTKAFLVVALVFSMGVGLGAAWKLGWIPITYVEPDAGSLLTAIAPPPDDSDAVTASSNPWSRKQDYATLADVDDQAEPPVEEGANHKLSAMTESPAEVEEPLVEAPIIRSSKSSANRPVRKTRDAPRRVEPVNYQEEPSSPPAKQAIAAEVEEPRQSRPEISSDRFHSVDEKLAAGEVLAAHRELSKIYWNTKTPDPELLEKLESLAQKIFFSPQTHFVDPYVIQSGDQLRKIASSYKLTWEYLAKLNKTNPRRIREGQKLKVLKGPFAAVVCLHDFSLTIHLQGYFVKRFSVGIGKDGTSPIGKFSVLNKLENPQYTDPDGKVIEGDDPANPLGERWIDLGDSYGIHGTIDPDSIGKAESRGCIRLRDADIIEVYDFLVVGSVVEIRQ